MEVDGDDEEIWNRWKLWRTLCMKSRAEAEPSIGLWCFIFFCGGRSAIDRFAMASRNGKQQQQMRSDRLAQAVDSPGKGSGSKRPNLPKRSSSLQEQQQQQQQHQQQQQQQQMERGWVVRVFPDKGYGFLRRCKEEEHAVEEQENGKQDLRFRFGEDSRTASGLLILQRGDVLEFISTAASTVSFARLLHCSFRSSPEMASYFRTLLQICAHKPDLVLREITKCPTALLLALQHPKPNAQIVVLVMKLVDMFSNWQEVGLYTSRLKQFFKLFAGTQFLISKEALRQVVHRCCLAERVPIFQYEEFSELMEAAEEIELEWGNPLATLIQSIQAFLLRLLRQIPDLLPSLVPLLEAMPQNQQQQEARQQQDRLSLDALNLPSDLPPRKTCFLLKVIAAVANAKAVPTLDLSWEKIPLLPLDSEFAYSGDSDTPLSNHLQLPVARMKGSYGSPENYIDTYVRLLREDCFASLKKGIAAFRSGRLDHRDMRIWVNVSAMGARFAKSSPGLLIALKCDDRHGNSSSSALPIGGSLLCISDDGGNFQSPIWAIVARAEKIVKQRAVVFFIEVLEGMGLEASKTSEASTLVRVMKGTDMIVAESPAYYKAYCPVLKALQRIDPNTMPFQEELVLVKWPGKAPDYLNTSTSLNWGCFLQEADGQQVIAGVNEFNKLLRRGFKTTLDQSQIDAVNHVISSRLAIIQGPPGTGKTFLAVKILQLLLSASTLPPKPVLLITYKNQALDQFLEACLKFCQKPGSLVRVGGRSASEKLVEHNLQVLVKRADQFSSDWKDNCTKLEQIQIELEMAIRDLHRCRFFNAKQLISLAPEKFLHQLVYRSALGKESLKLIPEGSSLTQLLQDFVRDSYQEISGKLRKAFFENVKAWMPQKRAFSSVQVCLSSRRLPRNFSQALPDVALDNSNSEEPEQGGSRDFEEENEERETLESIWQDMRNGKNAAGFPGPRENEWLQNNFLSFDSEDKDALFTGFQLFDFDAEEYYWLLQVDPWELVDEQRCIFILVMMQQNLEANKKRLSEVKNEYDHMCLDNDEINKRRIAAVLQDAKIVGMTTTGAAMNQEILMALSPSVIVVEEAAEILEPQLMAVLGQSVQHLILIGDHYQLRPSVESYELESRHNLAVSMFERLAEHNKLPFRVLSLQSRMREEFLNMLLPIYPHLKSNTQLVSGHRNKPPQCMMSTMHFWSHSFQETAQRSYANEGEAYMIVALSRWFLSEGHKPEDISVICAYNGQVSLLRKKFKDLPETENIDVNTIDKFQGSENQIIIVSLVRSNPEGRIGHLAIRNRLCVSVSRARSAIYFCGNVATLTVNSAHWRTLTEYFRSRECLGDLIFLQCPRHPYNPFVLSSEHAETFYPRLCKKPCKAPLACGHFCADSCHDGMHAICKEEIKYIFKNCGHTSTKLCSEDEDKMRCQREVWYQLAACGHIKNCKCWEKQDNTLSVLKCEIPCGKILECGHPCTLSCSEKCASSPCTKCAEIEKIKAAKEKELAMRELQRKLQKIDSEIESLKCQERFGPVLKELLPDGETAAEYRMVQDRTEKFIQPSHTVLPVVTRIQKVSNSDLEIKYLEAHRDLIEPGAFSQLLFHGTNDEAVDRIIHSGFRLPGKERKNMYGRGCYFAMDSSKSAQPLYTKGSNRILLCEVLLGRSWTLEKAHPELDLKTVRGKMFDSVYSQRNSKQTGGTEFDEYVIYNPHQAIARYIVHYKNLDCNAPELHKKAAALFTQTPLKASKNYTGDNYEEYHFRFAESQFLRMSQRKDQKVNKVELIHNEILKARHEKLKKQFMDQGKPIEEMLVFHGTAEENIDKIILEGFKIGGEGVPIKFGAAFGKGVYTAFNPDISIHYSSGSGMMLLSIALLGNENVDYKLGGSSNVFVFQHVDQLLPRYIVHFCPQ